MISIIIILAVSSLIWSGIIFSHRRILTYLSTSAALFEAFWLLLGFIHRVMLPHANVDSIYLIGSSLMLAISILLLFNKRWQTQNLFQLDTIVRDVFILPALVITFVSALLITQANYQHGNVWTTYGFFNGDTLTLISLVQRSRLVDGLLTTNPLASNGALEYPTLLHGTIADALTIFTAPWEWFRNLPLYTYLQIGVIVPLFFLLFDLVLEQPKERWQMWLGIKRPVIIYALQTMAVVVVMGLSWDNYIYPQSHFFLTAIFLLVVGLFIHATKQFGKSQLLLLIPAFAFSMLLYCSNAVTGTAAIALASIFCLHRIFTKSRSVQERTIFLAILAVLAYWYVRWTPGQPALGHIHFAYTAAYDMMALAPILILSLLTAWLGLQRQPILALSAITLSGMAMIIFFFSSRAIITSNASRFFYHAVLLAFPLAIPLFIQAYFWMRRQILYTTHTLLEMLLGLGGILIMLIVVAILPTGASILSAHKNLMYEDQQSVGPFSMKVMQWIASNTPTNSIIVTSPKPPWPAVIFSGRAIVRMDDYWLSPQDDTLHTLNAAYAGDKVAQKKVYSLGNYLFVRLKEKRVWGTIPYKMVYTAGTSQLYDLSQPLTGK